MAGLTFQKNAYDQWRSQDFVMRVWGWIPSRQEAIGCLVWGQKHPEDEDLGAKCCAIFATNNTFLCIFKLK